jgi:hypothetical protein
MKLRAATQEDLDKLPPILFLSPITEPARPRGEAEQNEVREVEPHVPRERDANRRRVGW